MPVVVQSPGWRPAARALRAGAETVVTCGVLILLLVVHQLWWTNHQALADARDQVRVLERGWDTDTDTSPGTSPGPGPGTSPDTGTDADIGTGAGAPLPPAGSETDNPPRPPGSPDPYPTGIPPGPHAPAAPFAVLRIPRLGLTVPVAVGVSRRAVLDKGYVGAYPGTGAPGRAGNFALAGHRNTHGEPFRYVNRLVRGDEISVRTREATYTYRVDRVLPRTAPRDVGVIRPVPRSLVEPSYGYDTPGAYLTLTTCTPEFSSAYRLVVWAKLVSTG
ncbi:class E sortase [Streptomyces sp. CBMA291]|nr:MULTISPECIES: class E sortase [unclassified Streptomyces]MBD0709846.1 class E sortase [Streptomyces sp. CBMA291]MBD0715056.1 class E sortase [Streptomyces sp. CBMA370]